MGFWSWLFKKPPINITTKLSGSQLEAQLLPLNLDHLFLWDTWYYIPTLEEWGRILKDVLFNMPAYTAEKFDCENFALLTTARVSEKYQVNTCGIAIGESPWGWHGFNILITKDAGIYYFEPQTGDFHQVNSNSGYKAHDVILG